MTIRHRRRLALALSLLAPLAATVPAHAASIAYEKGGDLHLASPDGATGYRVTYDGGWTSPSQADDGTLLGVKAKTFVHVDRSGRALGAPVPGVGTDAATSGNFKVKYGPWEAEISPDARHIAYWIGTETFGPDPSCLNQCVQVWTQDVTLVSDVDRFTPPEVYGQQEDYSAPRWVGNDRLMAFNDGLATNVILEPIGAGRNAGAGWLDRNELGEGRDGDISRDGRTTVLLWRQVSSGTSRLIIARQGRTPEGGLAVPDARCVIEGGTFDFDHPSLSPDGTLLAYQAGHEGIHLVDLHGIDVGCDALDDHLVIPGGTNPSFGPADVDLRQAPPAPGTGPAPTGTPATGTPAPAPASAGRLTKVRLKVRGRRPVVRFTAPAATRVRIAVRCAAGARCRRLPRARTVHARPGANAVRLPALRRGRYTVVLRPAGGRAVRRAVRVRR